MDKDTKKLISYWLSSAIGLLIVMVIIGGITRLTKSGLSMTDWQPIYGVIPPITETDWLEEFNKYKQFPEYQKLNNTMTLEEFKFIFFWEYIHRIIGRALGLLFILPFTFLLIKKRLNKSLMCKLLVCFFLGALQGLFGWYMVKSGLVDVPYVSHYRLAVHLILAFIIINYIFWILLNINKNYFKKSDHYIREKLSLFLTCIIVVIFIQIIYGAFTAGLKAGFGWNTFPKMGGYWIPRGLLPISPLWKNFFENHMTVQFIHRYLGWLLCMLIPAYWNYAKSFKLSTQQNIATNLLLYITIGQFFLGMFTLIMVVPIWLAVFHQLGAILLLSISVYNYFLINNI